mgnify:FL=1
MNKLCLIALSVSLLVSTAGVYYKQHRGAHNAKPVCEVYYRCAAQPGVEATFVEAMRFNDTVTLDVTTIVATTDEGWLWMCDSLQQVPDVVKASPQNFEISHIAPACNSGKTSKYIEGGAYDLVVVSIGQRKIFIFHGYRPSYRQTLKEYQRFR